MLVEGRNRASARRVLLEWLRDELGEDATWVEGHCASYGGQPLCHAPAEALRGWVGVEDAVRRGATLERLGLEPDALPYLASLISVDDGEESLPAQFDAGLGARTKRGSEGLHGSSRSSLRCTTSTGQITARSRWSSASRSSSTTCRC